MVNYAVVDRCPDTGWGTAVFFEWALETLRHVRERLSGEINFEIYDLETEDKIGLGELAKRAEQEKILQDLSPKSLASGLDPCLGRAA